MELNAGHITDYKASKGLVPESDIQDDKDKTNITSKVGKLFLKDI